MTLDHGLMARMAGARRLIEWACQPSRASIVWNQIRPKTPLDFVMLRQILQKD